MAKIAIDAGHYGYDSGAVGPTGLQEATVTHDVAQRIAARLRAAGHDVKVIQSYNASSLNADLMQRVQAANAWAADLYVSIHVNCVDDPAPAYYSTWIYDTGGEAEKLAKAVHPQVVKATGAPDGSIRTANFYVLRKTDMPAILTENLFISNPGQEAALKTDAMRDAIAQAHCDGILKYLGEGGKPVADQWKLDIVAKAKAAGLITEDHAPDDPAPVWFILAVALNVLDACKGGKK